MSDNVLCHWGKKGMKWGVRRYQNLDGSLTAQGRKRYARDAREKNSAITTNLPRNTTRLLRRMVEVIWSLMPIVMLKKIQKEQNV